VQPSFHGVQSSEYFSLPYLRWSRKAKQHLSAQDQQTGFIRYRFQFCLQTSWETSRIALRKIADDDAGSRGGQGGGLRRPHSQAITMAGARRPLIFLDCVVNECAHATACVGVNMHET
jgi:hypothetical protein